MKHSVKIALVTAGLLAAGAVFGALAGMVGVAVAIALTDGLSYALDPLALGFAAMAGAFLGGILFPAAAWLLMRRVPLGLAVAGTLLGTVAGGVLGWVVADAADPIGISVAAAMGGFAVSCVGLRLRYSRGERQAVRVPSA